MAKALCRPAFFPDFLQIYSSRFPPVVMGAAVATVQPMANVLWPKRSASLPNFLLRQFLEDFPVDSRQRSRPWQGSCCCHRTAGVRPAGALGHTSAEISAFVYSHAWIQVVVSVLAGWRLLLEGLHPSHQPAEMVLNLAEQLAALQFWF